jgi:4a-hydroxytetrahydrobiopterin dehydratase
MQYASITPDEFAALDGLDDWRYVLGAVRATFRAPSYPAAAELVVAFAEAAERAVHHPDLDVRYPGRVLVALTTHAVGGITTADVDLAREYSSIAPAHGAVPEAHAAEAVEIALDTVDVDAVRPFWAAVLGYREVGPVNLVDPQRIGPPMWFQHTDEPRTERGRFHLDVTVPHDVAEQRVAAALAAGGRLVTDAHARSWWVLADAEGNEACICTWQDRSPEG